jgi:glycosyltransferase involved in cell wall biosynthesis/ubiquinone/menaquinone biosynthesis C-methylase UbiE
VNITHVQYSFSIENGGPTESLNNFCRGQVAAGHEVSVWTLEGFPYWSSAIRLPPPVEMNVFQVEWPTKLGGSAEMRRQLRVADSPDIYHLHGVWLQAMRYGANEALRRKIPYILEFYGMYEPWGLGNRWFLKRGARLLFQDRIIREAACLHVNSPQEAENIRKLGFKTPIAVIPGGVDLEAIDRRKSALPAEAPWHELKDRPFILYLSRLHPKKGLDLLLRSWAKNPKSEDWMLVIAGSGQPEYVQQCKLLAVELGIANQCVWLGHVDELQKSWLYAKAHCYVLPTSSENFGATVAEALAHGTPVITTRHTPWKDLEEHGCGWFVDNTEIEISRALHEALSLDAIARGRMGDAGERLVRERCSLRAVLSDINAVYEWLSGGTSVPACVQLESESGERPGEVSKQTSRAREDGQSSIEQSREVEVLFDQKAATWSKKYGMGGSLRPRLYAFEERLGELAQPPAQVLDFGCGTGNLAGHLSARGYALSACDISSKMVEWARKSKHGASVTWHVLPTGWRELPFASNTFDAIVASSVFEYLTSIDMTLAELWRMLKPGGFLIATVPNNRHVVRKLENFLRPMAAMAQQLPVLNRIQKLNSYATYLHCSRNRMPLDEWFAIGNRARFEAVGRDRSHASKAVLIPLVFRKNDNS